MQWDRSAQHKGALFGTAEEFAVVYVFADAFNRAQSFEPERVRNAISETDLDTFFGHIKFDSRV